MLEGSPSISTLKLEPQWGQSICNSLMPYNLANPGPKQAKKRALFYFLLKKISLETILIIHNS